DASRLQPRPHPLHRRRAARGRDRGGDAPLRPDGDAHVDPGGRQGRGDLPGLPLPPLPHQGRPRGGGRPPLPRPHPRHVRRRHRPRHAGRRGPAGGHGRLLRRAHGRPRAAHAAAPCPGGQHPARGRAGRLPRGLPAPRGPHPRAHGGHGRADQAVHGPRDAHQRDDRHRRRRGRRGLGADHRPPRTARRHGLL
ncbi:MAG: Transcriptional regulator, AcrR family, partial [uncultured Solirubrobacteraceae bacterium]